MNNSDTEKFRVGIYLRLSNEDKDKENNNTMSESIKNQRNMLIDYINKHKNFILKDEYCDEDLSGAGAYRPEFERLIRDCKSRKLDIVLCKSQSRFSRDMEIVEQYINNKFKEWNIRFISISDNADTNNLGNKKARQINGLVNEWYLEDVSNNIRSAFNSKMKHGEFISPFAAYGYEVSKENNNKLIIDVVAANIVKKIFKLYISGYGFTAIAKYLNDKNVPCPSLYKYIRGSKLNIASNRKREEIKWNSNAIKRILTNELYLGNLVQGKRTTASYKNHKIIRKPEKQWIVSHKTHQAIIDNMTFNKVQEEKKRTRVIKKTGIVHIFSGKVFCLECNCCMRKKNSKEQQYLVCSNNENGYSGCSNSSSIRYDALADIILKLINKKLEMFYDETILSRLYSKNIIDKINYKTKSLEAEKLNIERQIIKNKNYLRCLYEDKTNNLITIKQFKDLYNNYNKNEIIYDNQLNSINKKLKYYKSKEKNLDNFQSLFYKYKKLCNLNRIIVQEFIEKIYIGKLDKKKKMRKIKVKWSF